MLRKGENNMQVQPISSQPKFNGKLVIDASVRKSVNELVKEHKLVPKFKEIASLVNNKPYDLFIYADKEKPEFYYVSANKSKHQAKTIKEYTVKIQSSIMESSIVDAANDAMEMYKKYISKSIKG